MSNVEKYKCLCTKQIINLSSPCHVSLSVRTISSSVFTISSSHGSPPEHARKSSIPFAKNLYFITRINGTVERAVDVFVSRSKNKDASVSSLRRHRMKNYAESAAEWPNITFFCFPSAISSFLFFLLLFLYRLFQHSLKNRDCSLSRRDSRVDDETAL